MSATDEEVTRLYRLYGPVIYRRCVRFLRDREEARDATQEVFLKLLRDPEKLRDPQRAVPWIYRSVANHCLNRARDQARHARRLRDFEVGQVEADTSFFPDRRLAAKVLSRFDAKTQAIAVAVLVDGMQISEAADTLQVSRKTVTRKIARFLDHARKYLTRSAP